MKKLLRSILVISFIFLAAQPLKAAQGQAPAAGRTVRVNDIEMYYEERGAGEPLVLLHGFGGCARNWQPFVAPLAEHFRLIVPDLRGHGRSTNPAGVFTHRQAAADVLALLDQLGVTRFKAMGISTGGMTLLHIATRPSARVERMVLIGATPYFPEQAREIQRKVSGDPTPEELQYFRQCAARGDSQALELRKQFGEFKDSYEDMNFTAPLLGTIRAQTLIVHGDRDEHFPVSIALEMYRAIPASALWIIPHGDHVPIFGARAREFEDVVLPFLRGERTAR